jgi:hypothetical protein
MQIIPDPQPCLSVRIIAAYSTPLETSRWTPPLTVLGNYHVGCSCPLPPAQHSNAKIRSLTRVAEPEPVGTVCRWGLQNRNRIRNTVLVPVPGTGTRK